MNRSETSLKQQVYTGVMDKIIKGEFAPDSILTEKMIIQEFCVSKSPVREALLELCKDNVLKSIPRCGYQVTQITIKTLHEITKMRLLLEISNFKEIAKLYDKERISAIFDSHESKRKNERKKNVWDANRNNLDFHLTLASLSGDELLKDFLKRTLELYTRAYAQMYTTIPNIMSPSTNHNHDLFIEAWKQERYSDAEEYLKADILTAETEIKLIVNDAYRQN